VVAHLKQQYGVQYLYVWHAMMGFWAGVMPGGETAKYNARVSGGRVAQTSGSVVSQPVTSRACAT
jgi:hypothetical protein